MFNQSIKNFYIALERSQGESEALPLDRLCLVGCFEKLGFKRRLKSCKRSGTSGWNRQCIPTSKQSEPLKQRTWRRKRSWMWAGNRAIIRRVLLA